MTNVQCTFLLEQRVPSQILSKALVLLEHQVLKNDVERQLKILNQYIDASKDGFIVKDIGNLMHLFEIIKTKMIDDPRFEKPVAMLLDLCHIPPRLVKASDLLTFALDIQEYFSWLGYMLVWLKQKDLQVKILSALYKLLTIDYPEKKYYLSLEARKERAQSGTLAEILGDLLEIVDDVVYGKMLKVLKVFIEGSKRTCIDLLKKGAISTMIRRLDPRWKHRLATIKPNMPTGDEEILHTKSIFHVLTVLFQYASADTMKAPTKFTLWSLQWAFRYFCIKETTRIERNNVLGILVSLMDIFPDLLSGNLTFSYDIAMLAMAKDIIFSQNWTLDIKLTTSNEDLCCMGLLLMSISYFPNCLSGPKIIEECRIVMGLLKLISHQQAIPWHQLQSCYLIRLALNILRNIIPVSTEDFIEDGGPLIILQLLHRSREFRTSYSYDIVFRAVEILSHFAFSFPSIRDSIAYNGGVACIIPLLEDHLDQPYLSMPNQLLLAAGFCLLEQICESTETTLVLPLIIKYMKRYIEPNKEDPVQNPKLMIVVLSFIWQNVTHSISNSKEFVNYGGVYLLLDVLQISCLSVRLVALGALIDLCERVECIPYLITWRSKGQRIKSLLIDIFREENNELFVKISDNGVLLDATFPIMGRDQFYETFCSCKPSTGNPSIGDMFVSCRIKVYCMLQILNSKQKETVEIVDEFYKLYEEDLSAKDEVTLILAENYLALKLSEEWKELDREFEKIGLEPVPTDELTIGAMIQITNFWGQLLKDMQNDVLQKHHIKDAYEERDLYTNLRNSRLSEAWNALCQLKYIARCSERLFRISSTFNLHKQINRSLAVNSDNGQLHRTLPSTISVSCLHDQYIDVPTDVGEKAPSVVLFPYSPVTSKNPSFANLYAHETEYGGKDKFLVEQFLPELSDNNVSNCTIDSRTVTYSKSSASVEKKTKSSINS